MNTRHVSIRPLAPGDAEAVHESVHESMREIREWMDWCRTDYCLDDARDWIETTRRGFEDGTQFQFGIVGGDDGYLGQVGLSHVNAEAKLANLGYWVRTSATGQGVAPRAVRALTEWAFRHTDLVRLEIVVAVGNDRSRRVAEKVGAVREGVLRSRLRVFDRCHDAIMYSIVRGDDARAPQPPGTGSGFFG